MNLLIKDMMKNGNSYVDIVNSDYYHLMEIFTAEEEKNEDKMMMLGDYIRNNR